VKLLVISHACVTSINQQFFAEVESQTGWDLILVTPSNWKTEYGKQSNSERWPEYQGELINIPVWKSGSIPLHTYQALFISLLKETQPDVIYVHHEPYAIATAQIYLANAVSSKAKIGFYSAQNIFKTYPIPFRQLEQWVLQSSQFAFPISYSVENVLKAKNCQAKCCVLPLGIDPNIYFPQTGYTQLSTQWHSGIDEVTIGFLGRIVPEKGLKTLLLALHQIKHISWKLVMAGSGSYESDMKGLAKELGLGDRVLFLGYIPHPEAPQYLSAFDILVLPSETQPNWKEQFGRVIIEAMACGTPVIGSDSGEIPYLIKATGGGLIFPEGQPSHLASCLKQLISDQNLRALLATQGQKVVLEQYTVSSIVQRFTQTIEQCISSKSSVEESIDSVTK
jgi:glycosyltransferase involved in cell wall biosynthesis